GRAEGWTWAELAAREPETAGALLTGRVDWPDGETAIEGETRAGASAHRIATTSRTRSIVVVSRGRFLSELAGALGASIGRDGLAPFAVIWIAASPWTRRPPPTRARPRRSGRWTTPR